MGDLGEGNFGGSIRSNFDLIYLFRINMIYMFSADQVFLLKANTCYLFTAVADILVNSE